MPEATSAFKQQLAAAFDALEAGQTFTFRRTFTDGDVALFCGVTGDYNPYHIDESFASESWYGRRIIPGLLTGSMLTHIGGMLGFLATEMTFQYLAPVYTGDTITCTVTFVEKDEARRRMVGQATFANQDGAEVLQARFSGFPGLLRLRADG
jgi:3-hydroxybutyryl-CoA dehydratase